MEIGSGWWWAVVLAACGVAFALGALFPHAGIRRHRIDPDKAARMRRQAFRHLLNDEQPRSGDRE